METLKKQNEQINRLSLNSEETVRNNLDCFRATTACLEHCLKLGGKHSEQNHITILKECAEVCQITASFLIEGSDFTHDICSICARLCDLCSDSCNEIGSYGPVEDVPKVAGAWNTEIKFHFIDFSNLPTIK